MSVISLVLLAAAVAVVLAAEWRRIERRFGAEARRRRERARRKEQWKVVRNDSEEFAASVERDLSNLPTIDERDR